MAYDGTLIFDSSLDPKGFQKGANEVSNIFKGLGIFKLVEKGFDLITSSVERAVNRYDTLNQFPRVLEQMGFSAGDASAATDKLAKGVQGLPTSLDEVVSTAQRLTTLTGNLDDSVDTTLALNNAFLMSGSSARDAERGLQQYVQMMSTGKVDMMSWRTLQETMAVALQEVAESFGFAGSAAQNELYAALRDGNITFEAFNARIVELNKSVGGFEDRARTATGGIGTAFDNLKTRTAAGVADIIKSIDEGFSKTKFESIEKIVDSAGTTIKGILSGLGDVFEFVARNIDKFAIALGTALGALLAFKIGTVIAGAVRTFSSAMEAAAIVTEWFSESEATAAATTGLLTTAQTIKTAVIGVLTGKMTLATAAQWAWNTAMAANPIGFILTLIALAIGAFMLLASVLGDTKSEADDLNDRMDELGERIESNGEAIRQTTKAHEESIRSLDAEKKSTEAMVRELDRLLANKENLHKNETKIKTQVDLLNKSVKGLNLSYNEQTGLLNKTTAEIRRYIDTTYDRIKLQAAEETAIELAKELAEAELNAADAAEAREEAEERLAAARARHQWLVEQSTEMTYAEEEAIAEANRTVGDYEKALAGLTEAEEAAIGIRDEAEGSYNKLVETIVKGNEEIAASEADKADALTEATERQQAAIDEYAEFAKKKYPEIRDAATNAFEKIGEAAETTAEEMGDTLAHNINEVDQWGKDMERLTSRSFGATGQSINPLLLEKLREMGPKGRGYVAALANATDEELIRMNTLMEAGANTATDVFQEVFGGNDFLSTGSDAIDEIAQQMAENKALDTATQTVVKAAHQAAQEQIKTSNFADVGLSIAEGIAQGIQSGSYKAINAVKNVIHSTIIAARNAADARSPARKFIPLGEDIDEGIAVGMESKKWTKRASTDLVNSALAAASQMQTRAGFTPSTTNNVITNHGARTTNYTYNSPKALDTREIRRQETLAQQRQRLGAVYG